jgi:hypothetical protein
MRRWYRLYPLLIPAFAACSSGTDLPGGPVTRIDSAAVSANPNMVVSALVRFDGQGDSAQVRFHMTGSATDSVTPWFSYATGLDTIAVLGLLPQTAYIFRLVLRGGVADSAISDSLTLTTGALPANLPSYAAGGVAPQPGFIVFSAGLYGLVIDRTGRVVWYKLFPPGGPGLNFMAQPTGTYVGRLTTPDPADVDPMVEVDAAGDVGRNMRCASSRLLRFHDMILLADGTWWMMCDDTRAMDLTAFGGVATAAVTGTTVQHLSATGALLFEWNPFDHFLITDQDSVDRLGTSVNWTHGNSFDLDTDGNLLVSFRSLSEITKINAQTGAVIWRMGGRRNQFVYAGAAGAGFSRQHNLRVIGPGRFIVLDNMGSTDTRFERYLVDTGTMTATLEQSYSAAPAVQTAIGGSVQQEAPDRFLVSFGTQGRVEEFDLSGTTLWKINGNAGYVFRAQRITSLYHPVPVTTR